MSSLILRRAPPIPPTSVYVYVWDRTAPVPPEFSIAKYSSHLGMANRMIASRSQHGWDSDHILPFLIVTLAPAQLRIPEVPLPNRRLYWVCPSSSYGGFLILDPL